MTLRFDAGELITAMVTPMNVDGSVNYDKVEELSKFLVENGTDAIVVVGTTGESPTLEHDEELEILSTIKRSVIKKAKIIMNLLIKSSISNYYKIKLCFKF